MSNSGAHAAELAAISTTISSSIAISLNTAQQAGVATKPPEPAPVSAQLAATSAAARDEVQSLQSDLFERRIFDPYLRFRSAEDEEAYRTREAEARRYIERQLAARTPEGDLNASGATMGQMLDAHSHGAGASPEFQPRWDRLEATTRRHRDAIRAEGHSTDEFDRNLKASVRRYLHDKGLSAAEIEAKLAVSASPLDAVKPYLKTERDAQQLGEASNFVGRLTSTDDITVTNATRAASTPIGTANAEAVPATPSIDDVMAKFKATGVVPAAKTTTESYSHGVDHQKPRDPTAATQVQ